MKTALSIDEKKETKPWLSLFKFSGETNFLLISCVFAFLLRLFLIQYQGVINGDGIYYARLAGSMISGDIYGGISTYWSPLYPILISISSLFFSDPEFAARFVSVIAGTLLVIPAYFLIRDLYGRIPAYLGVSLLVIHPSLIQASVWVMTESLYTLIFTTCLLVGWRALQSGRTNLFFFTGLLFGAAYLTKPEAIGFIGLFFIITIAAKFFRRTPSIKYLAFGYLLLGFTILFLPYFIVVHQKTGHWTISQKMKNNIPAIKGGKGLLSLSDDEQSTRRDRLFSDTYFEESQPTVNPQPVVVAPQSSPPPSGINLKDIISRTFRNLENQIREELRVILPTIFILFAMLGFLSNFWVKKRIAGQIYLLSFFICTLLGYALTVTELRYLFPVIPILLCWTSLGIVVFSNGFSKYFAVLWRGEQKLNPAIIQAITLLIFIGFLLPANFGLLKSGSWHNVPYEEKMAGLWLRDQTKQPSLIMSPSATVAFYAGTEHIFLPNEEFSRVFNYAENKKINYLVVSRRRAVDTPNFSIPPEQNLPPELKLVYKNEQNPDFYILIYQLAN